MKLTQIIMATLLLSSASVVAEGRKGEMLAKAKAMASENIDAKISLLNNLKSCINSANDRAALKECRKEAKSKRQSLKESNKARRQQMKEERQKRRAERKKNKEK
jgi:hypothetical protein